MDMAASNGTAGEHSMHGEDHHQPLMMLQGLLAGGSNASAGGETEPPGFFDLEFKVAQAHIIGGISIGFVYFMYLWATLHRYYKAEFSARYGWRPSYTFESTVPVTSSWLGNRPILGYIFMISGFGILATEIPYGAFDNENIAMHTGILLALTLYGTGEVLFYHGYMMPKNWDYCLMILYNFMVSHFVTVHYDGVNSLDHLLRVEIHKYLRYSAYLATVTYSIELACKKNVFAALARCFVGLLGSTWSLLLGILYLHGHDVIAIGDTEEQIFKKKLAFKNYYVLNWIFWLLFVGAMMFIVPLRVKCLGPDTPTYELKPKGTKSSDAYEPVANTKEFEALMASKQEKCAA
jgi:hypothetical protein